MSKRGAKQTPVRSLHICPDCGSKLVQPTSWEQVEERGHWRVWRRCPECEWSSDSVHGESEIDAFDEELDIGAIQLGDELRALERANMAEMVEVFALAIAADLIGPEDFA